MRGSTFGVTHASLWEFVWLQGAADALDAVSQNAKSSTPARNPCRPPNKTRRASWFIGFNVVKAFTGLSLLTSPWDPSLRRAVGCSSCLRQSALPCTFPAARRKPRDLRSHHHRRHHLLRVSEAASAANPKSIDAFPPWSKAAQGRAPKTREC